jgi:hypothetical protein
MAVVLAAPYKKIIEKVSIHAVYSTMFDPLRATMWTKVLL